jgi:AcrR family transcriptional regulator
MGEDMAKVGRRARPAQARSQVTLERILEAARKVLVERGVAGFNTNVVAEVAGVNVGTLYHYFADKNAVLQELFARDENARAAFMSSVLPEYVTTDDLDGWLRKVIGGLAGIRQDQLGTVMLRRACRATPELAGTHERATAAMVPSFAAALVARHPDLPMKRARVVARTVLELGAAGLDLMTERPKDAAALKRELVAAIRSYLESVAATTRAAGA